MEERGCSIGTLGPPVLEPHISWAVAHRKTSSRQMSAQGRWGDFSPLYNNIFNCMMKLIEITGSVVIYTF